MKRNFYFLIGVLSALFLSGCAKEIPGAFWGETEHYKNFLWVDYEPVRMEQTLVFDFNEDSKNLLTEPVRFEIVEKDLEGNIIQPNDINVYVNGELCPSNIFSVTKDDTEIPLCIIFKDDAREGNHTLFLREVGNNGLDRVEYLQLDKGFVVKKKDVTNPLQLGVTWSVIIIAIILVVWILLVQLILTTKFKSTQIKKIFVMVDGGRKNIQGYNQSVEGAKEIILTPTDKKQGFIARLFTGKVVYVKIKGLPGEITLLPGSGRYQAKSTQDRKKFEVETSGENNELKVVKATDGDYAVEYYAKSK